MTQTPQDATRSGPDDGLGAFKDMLQEQRERQGRLRHVQQFLTSPLFFDLRDQPVSVSDPPEAIAARKRELDYRIRVLESLVALLIEERDLLDRTQSAAGPADMTPESDPESGPA